MQSDILFFNRIEGKRTKLQNCEIVNDFIFSKNNFFLVYKSGMYFVCISVNQELVSLWKQKEIDNGAKLTPSNVMSIFRNKYIKNNITQEKIDFFIENPLEYVKKYKKP